MINDHSYKPKQKDNILFKALEDGAVLFEPESELVHSLNASAAFIWVHCDGEHSVTEIISLVKENFTEFELQPAEGVLDILNTFESLNLFDT
jgi:hypothetical protein